jgi:hypothetical protein
MRFIDLVKSISQKVSDGYLESETNPTETLAKHASAHNLTELQIDRVVNKSNRNIIVGLQKSAASKDPHFTFPIVKTAEVMAIMVPGKSKTQLTSSSEETKKKIDDLMRKVFPKPVSSMPSMFGETPNQVLSSFSSGDQVSASRNTMLQSLSMMRHKLSLIKSRYRAAENALDDAIMNLEKTAAMAYQTQPVKVIEKIRGGFSKSASVNSVFDYVKDGHRGDFLDIESDFRVVEGNELSKAASKVIEREDDLKGVSLELKSIKSEYERLKKACG